MPATKHREQTLPVETKKSALRLRVDGGLLPAVQHARCFPDKVTGRQDGDRDCSGRLLHHQAAAALFDEEDRVAGVTLEKDHLAAGNPDAAQAAGESAEHRLRHGVEHRRALEYGEARDHVVECGPRDLRALLGSLVRRAFFACGEHGPPWSGAPADLARAWPHPSSRYRVNPHRASTWLGPMIPGAVVGGQVESAGGCLCW